MANSLDRGLEQALSDLDAGPAPDISQDGDQQDSQESLERSDHLHLRQVKQEVRSLRRGQRRMWVAMGLMIFAVAGSVALNLVV